MAKDEEVEWRRMRRLNGEGSKGYLKKYFSIIVELIIPEEVNRVK